MREDILKYFSLDETTIELLWKIALDLLILNAYRDKKMRKTLRIKKHSLGERARIVSLLSQRVHLEPYFLTKFSIGPIVLKNSKRLA